MIKAPAYLLNNILEVLVDPDTNRNNYLMMYQRELEVQRGIRNRFEINFLNSDQKRVDVSTATFTGTFYFEMFQSGNNRRTIQQPLTILDDGTYLNRGRASLQLEPYQLQALTNGEYQYVIKKVEPDGIASAAYANTYFGVSGSVKVKSDAIPNPVPSLDIVDFNRYYDYTNLYYFWNTGVYKIDPVWLSGSALHTVQIYFQGFTGVFKAQGTLLAAPNSPGNNNVVGDIVTRTYNTPYTGIDYFNFTGNYSGVQFYWRPYNDTYGNNYYPLTDVYPNGQVARILYRY